MPVVRLLLDADGLIKLFRAGVLAATARAYACLVPEAVYDEAVTEGKARHHPDAEFIEQIVREAMEVKTNPGLVRQALEAEEARLGPGERAVLELYSRTEGDIVVSDDRYFLGLLARRTIPFVVPAALIVLMVRNGALEREEAKAALERLRPSTRESVYREAIQHLAEASKE